MFKNDQDICWLEHDYMEMKMIVRDQTKNYFHLTLKIGPLWGEEGGGVVFTDIPDSRRRGHQEWDWGQVKQILGHLILE